MTAEGAAYAVAAADEWRHSPESDPLWNESWYADVVSADGAVAAYVRLGFYPNLGTTWWHVAVVGAGRPMVVCQRTDLPVSPEGIEVSADGVDVVMSIDSELESFAVRSSMTGARHESPIDVYDGKPGAPVSVEIDLTWTTDGVPYQYDVTARYEIPCAVTGTVTVDGEQLRLDGPGQRDHSWGVRDWWSFGWCWSAGHLDDGTHTHLTDVRIPGMQMAPGYVQRGGELQPAASGSVTEELSERGLPLSATVRHDDLAVEVEPIAFGPILLTAPDGRVGYFPRASARFSTADGRKGLGWIEWNQPPEGE